MKTLIKIPFVLPTKNSELIKFFKSEFLPIRYFSKNINLSKLFFCKTFESITVKNFEQRLKENRKQQNKR